MQMYQAHAKIIAARPSGPTLTTLGPAHVLWKAFGKVPRFNQKVCGKTAGNRLAPPRIQAVEETAVNIRDVQAEMQRTRYAFLTTDLEVCVTFSKIVETKLALGKPDAARRVLESAKAGYATVRRLFPERR
jgi:hypothetical protein